MVVVDFGVGERGEWGCEDYFEGEFEVGSCYWLVGGYARVGAIFRSM